MAVESLSQTEAVHQENSDDVSHNHLQRIAENPELTNLGRHVFEAAFEQASKAIADTIMARPDNDRCGTYTISYGFSPTAVQLLTDDQGTPLITKESLIITPHDYFQGM